MITEMKILLPALPEQQKIASILSNVDAQMQQTQKLIDLTQRLKKGLMQKLFTEGIGHNKFKKVKLFPKISTSIPEDWDLVRFETLISKLKRGPSKAANEEGKGFIYVTSDFLDDEGNIQINEMKCLEKEDVDNPNTCLLMKNDLILNLDFKKNQYGKDLAH